MRHLGNCGPMAFIAAAPRVREALMDWLKAVDAAEIWRRHMGDIDDDAPAEVVGPAHAAMLGEVVLTGLTRCPALTRELLCAATFTDPADFDARPMRDYIEAALEIYADRAIRDFFTLLAALTLPGSSGA